MAGSLDEAKSRAKARIASEKAKVSNSIKRIVGSPVLIAIFAALTLAFGAHIAFFQERLPEISGNLSVQSFGLPPLDFGVLGEAVQDATDAALRQGAAVEAQNFLASYVDLIPLLNGVGFGVSLVLLIWALAIQSEKRRREASQGIMNRA